MTVRFTINNTSLHYSISKFPFTVNSFPSPYQVDVISTILEYQALTIDADILIIDQKVLDAYPLSASCNGPSFLVDATEDNKNMNTVLSIIDFFIDNQVSKGSKVIAIGGGIVQDLCACACSLFRRGQPFLYLPTTTLGQLDSCVGAKCAVNTYKAKNIIGLFSAPSKVVIPTPFICSMPFIDHRAGLSEMLRLCLTASSDALECYCQYFPSINNPKFINLPVYMEALSLSLSIKKAVVDFDEYERDIRRSMNYGHTFAHSIEKLSNFSLPHGLAVLLGMHMANNFAKKIDLMSETVYNRISNAVQMTIKDVSIDIDSLQTLNPIEVLEQFKFDKKGDGKSVPLILLKSPGEIVFYRHFFNGSTAELVASVQQSLEDFMLWTQA